MFSPNPLADPAQGTVLQLRDGTARVQGLAGCMLGEEVTLDQGLRGWAMRVEEDGIVCAILDNFESLRAGAAVQCTGQLLQVPCGTALLGRVVDPLGRPLDDGPPIQTSHSCPLNHPGPTFIEVRPLSKQLPTGIKILDVLFPLRCGENRLLLGPHHTGKTTLAVDVLQFAHHSEVIGVYIAVGLPRQEFARIVARLRQSGAMGRSIVVASSPDDPPALQLLTPFAGFVMGEFLVRNGGHDVLCVLDDLNHLIWAGLTLFHSLENSPNPLAVEAEVLGILSRILGRASARAEHWVIVPQGTCPTAIHPEAAVNRTPAGAPVVYVGPWEQEKAKTEDLPNFPGHQLMQVAQTGGSLTALTLIETDPEEDLPLTGWSLQTVGLARWVLDAERFQAGFRPALDERKCVGHGGRFVFPIMRRIHQELRNALVLMERVAREPWIGEPDMAARQIQQRGQRLRELLKQQPGRLLDPIEQVISLWAGLSGFLDSVPLGMISEFETALLDACHRRHPEVFPMLREVRHPWSEPWAARLEEVIREFQTLLGGKSGM